MANFATASIRARPQTKRLKDQIHHTHNRREATSSDKAKVFTVVDVSEAFHTIELDEESSLLTTFRGPDGCYCYNRMPFGIASGPEEYQRRQHQFLGGLNGVINIADDICGYRNLTHLLEKCSEHDF